MCVMYFFKLFFSLVDRDDVSFNVLKTLFFFANKNDTGVLFLFCVCGCHFFFLVYSLPFYVLSVIVIYVLFVYTMYKS
jgi:hypothetical protein